MSVPIDDDSVRAYAACRDLRALYQAYQATSRAYRLVLARVAAAERSAADVGSDRNLRMLQYLAQRIGLAAETDVVFGQRGEQLRRRMLQLRDLPDTR